MFTNIQVVLLFNIIFIFVDLIYNPRTYTCVRILYKLLLLDIFLIANQNSNFICSGCSSNYQQSSINTTLHENVYMWYRWEPCLTVPAWPRTLIKVSTMTRTPSVKTTNTLKRQGRLIKPSFLINFLSRRFEKI